MMSAAGSPLRLLEGHPNDKLTGGAFTALFNRLVMARFITLQETGMDIQRLRNLTTGLLHTDIDFIYEDLGQITGQRGLMTHMLPRAMKAIEPWLRKHVTDQHFWNGEYDPTHTGEYALPEPTDEDRETMTERYMAQPNPLVSKEVVGVLTSKNRMPGWK